MKTHELDTNCFACGAKVDHDDPNLEIRQNNHVVCCSEGYSGVSDAELERMGAGYITKTEYDYVNQAWVIDGTYQRCGHQGESCGCFGRLHAGEPMFR